jgi:hypothetical protein
MGTEDTINKQILLRQDLTEALCQTQHGLKVPKGGGWFTNPKRAGYNRVYDRSTLSFWTVLKRLFR